MVAAFNRLAPAPIGSPEPATPGIGTTNGQPPELRPAASLYAQTACQTRLQPHADMHSLSRTVLGPLAAWLLLQAAPSAIAAEPALPPVTSACLKPGNWTWLGDVTPRQATAQSVLPRLAERDVILLGEQHDKTDDHRWQLQTIAALAAMRTDIVIGFEAFPRRVQPVLDRWVNGELTAAEFLDRVEWNKVWGMPAELYLPLFEFARINRIPMVALNVERKLIRSIASKGSDAVPLTEREGVSRPAAPPPPYVDNLFETHREHARMRGSESGPAVSRNDPAFRNFVDAQATWDRAMAEVLARRLNALPGPRPLVVGIIGSGHLRNGYGVAHQLRDLGVTRIATLLPVASDTPCAEIRPGLADAVFAVPPQASAPEQPRLGVSLSESERGVHVIEVSPGSLAEQSGVRAGDLIVELAGAPISKAAAVVAAVRNQPAGTWLPLRVRRDSELLELVVRFPARG